MKVLMFTDLHIRSKHTEVIRSSRDWLCERIIEYDPHLVVMLGDTFHAFTSVEIPDLALGVEFYSDLHNVCGVRGSELVVLVGNHDQYSRDGLVHSLGFLDLMPARDDMVVNRDPAFRMIGDRWAAFLGYTPWEEGKEIDFGSPDGQAPDVLFTHCPIEGIEPQIKDSHAWPEEAFGQFHRVFCGHYHNPKEMGKFRVVGSLAAQSFSDDPVPRGVLLWDGKHNVDFIENPHSPFYATVDEEADLALLGGCDKERTHLRVRLPEVELEKFSDIWEQCASFQAIPQAEGKEINRTAISIEMPVEQAIVEYAEQVCPEDLDPEKLGAVGVAFAGGQE